MSHLDEGTLLTLRDTALVEVSVRDHLAECADCHDAFQEARVRAEAIESLLSELDEPHDVGAAKANVRGRLDTRPLRSPRTAGSLWSSGFGRAAAVLLLAAGAVSALPGSPVRSWITGAPSEPDEASATTQAGPSVERSAVAVPTDGNGIRVVLAGAAAGIELEVIWVEGTTARVSAPEGSAFSYGDGVLEAQLAEGAVRVELPNTGPVVVEVDGLVYVRRADDVVEVEGPLSEQSESRMLFTIPQR
jgi:hypothetical protein